MRPYIRRGSPRPSETGKEEVVGGFPDPLLTRRLCVCTYVCVHVIGDVKYMYTFSKRGVTSIVLSDPGRRDSDRRVCLGLSLIGVPQTVGHRFSLPVQDKRDPLTRSPPGGALLS